MRTEILRTKEEFARLRGEWNRLLSQSAADTIFLTKGDALDRHILNTPTILIIDHIATVWAQVTFNINAKLFLDICPQFMRNKM